jgi:hypothetical protein
MRENEVFTLQGGAYDEANQGRIVREDMPLHQKLFDCPVACGVHGLL